MKEYRKQLKEYATEIEIGEVINRKVFKLKTDLVYGPEKRDRKEQALDFNYYQQKNKGEPSLNLF